MNREAEGKEGFVVEKDKFFFKTCPSE